MLVGGTASLPSVQSNSIFNLQAKGYSKMLCSELKPGTMDPMDTPNASTAQQVNNAEGRGSKIPNYSSKLHSLEHLCSYAFLLIVLPMTFLCCVCVCMCVCTSSRQVKTFDSSGSTVNS